MQNTVTQMSTAKQHAHDELMCSLASRAIQRLNSIRCTRYGQFSKYNVCFCGLDPGNLKFETVRTHKHHICF